MSLHMFDVNAYARRCRKETANLNYAGVAEWADATDLKSVARWACGFEPRLRYQLFQRAPVAQWRSRGLIILWLQVRVLPGAPLA